MLFTSGKAAGLINTKVNPGLTIPPGMVYKDKFLLPYEDVATLSS